MKTLGTAISLLALTACTGFTPKPVATAELQSCQNILPDEIHFTPAERSFLHGKPELYIKLVEQQREIHWADQ